MIEPGVQKWDIHFTGPTNNQVIIAGPSYKSCVFIIHVLVFSTPPPRGDAFDEFKKEKGSEINRILTENKGRFLRIHSLN